MWQLQNDAMLVANQLEKFILEVYLNDGAVNSNIELDGTDGSAEFAGDVDG